MINKKSTVPTRDALHFQTPAVVEQPAYIVDFAYYHGVFYQVKSGME